MRRAAPLATTALLLLAGCAAPDLVVPRDLVPEKWVAYDETHFPYDEDRPVDEIALLPGDEVQVEVSSAGKAIEDCSLAFRVPGRGLVRYPYLGEVQVRGQTLRALKERILLRLKGAVLAEPTIRADFVNFANRAVTLQGPFVRPGEHPLNPLKKQSLALFVVRDGGGLRRNADRRRLVLRRRAQFRVEDREVDFVALADGSQPKIILEPGDVIQARPVAPIRVMGAVTNPMYELPYPDKVLKLREAILMAGGFTKYADQDRIEIRRVGRDGKTGMFRASYAKIEEDLGKQRDSTHDVELVPGDIIQVNWLPY